MNPVAGQNLLVITEVFYPEEFLVNDLVFGWQAEGRRVTVLTRNPSYPAGRIYPGFRNRLFTRGEIRGIRVHRVQFIPGYKENRFIKILNYLWNMLLGIFWALKNGRNFDAVCMVQTGPLTFSAIGVLIGRMYRKRTVIWTQDVWPETVFAYGVAQRGIARWVLECFVRWVYRGCDRIAVSSPGFIPLLQRHVPGKPITFIPQWPATVPAGESAGEFLLPDGFRFVFAGNIGMVQNLENVLLGWEHFQRQAAAEGAWLIIVGDGSHLSALQQMVTKRSIPQVVFTGRVPARSMPAVYCQSDVLVISLDDRPVFNMTIPAKFQAYLEAGRPMFGVIAGEVASLISRHTLGRVADPNNPAAISREFETLFRTPAGDLKNFSAHAATLLEETFSRDRSVAALTRLVSPNDE